MGLVKQHVLISLRIAFVSMAITCIAPPEKCTKPFDKSPASSPRGRVDRNATIRPRRRAIKMYYTCFSPPVSSASSKDAESCKPVG